MTFDEIYFYHVIYKITNNVNRNFYIGVHSTNDMNDSYMGSGQAVKMAMRNYGKEKFSKEILHIFETRKEALDKERELVNPTLLKMRSCYNMNVGGGDKPIRDPNRRTNIVMVLCLQTGIFYDSIKEAAIAKNMKYHMLLHRINNHYMQPYDIIVIGERRVLGFEGQFYGDQTEW